MGIKGLKKFIRETFPDLIKTVHISEFSNEKIAVDTSSYIYSYKAVFGDTWLNSFPNLIYTLKKWNIHGNFIFDGKAPKEKDKERAKRGEQKEKLEDNVMNLSLELDLYKSSHQSTPFLVEVMAKINKSNVKTQKITRMLHAGKTESDPDYINIEAVEEYLKKKERQIINFSKDDIENLKKMLELFGVPYIQAPGEAEALGAYMSSIGKVKAVLTEDTDVLAYGTSIYLSDLNSSTGYCEAIYLSEVLEALKYSLDEFLDFCVMCGTDYNDNIPGYACKTVFKFINEHRNIETFIDADKKLRCSKKKSEADYTILNHNRSRELFKTFGDLIVSDISRTESYNCTFWDNNIDFDVLYDFLRTKKCRYVPSTIEEYWKEPEIVFEEEEIRE